MRLDSLHLPVAFSPARCLSGHWHSTQPNSRRPSVRGLYTGPDNLIDQPLFLSRPVIGGTARRCLQLGRHLGAKCRPQVVFGLLSNGKHVITRLAISFVVRCGEMDVQFGVI